MAALRSESLRHARIQVTTLGDLLLTAADRYPDSPALIFPGLRVTYAQLAARALARARCLQALGVRPREHVGLLLPTWLSSSSACSRSPCAVRSPCR